MCSCECHPPCSGSLLRVNGIILGHSFFLLFYTHSCILLFLSAKVRIIFRTSKNIGSYFHLAAYCVSVSLRSLFYLLFILGGGAAGASPPSDHYDVSSQTSQSAQKEPSLLCPLKCTERTVPFVSTTTIPTTIIDTMPNINFFILYNLLI